jgi:hypothetical protein
MKLLVCGSRDIIDTPRIYAEIERLKPKAIVQGAARGVDSIAGLYAIEHGLANIEVAANWDFYRKAAGPIRNRWMLNFCQPDLVLAFPSEDSIGTRNMMEIAAKAGVEVIER